MQILQNLGQGFIYSAHFNVYVMVAFGVFIGIVIGALPGLSVTTGVSIFLPFTFYMDAVTAFGFLLGIYCGGTYGGSITAILINTPGTPNAAATALEGYPLSKKGQALKALEMALYASFVGGIISCIILLYVSPLMAKMAIKFGSAEYFILGVFGITIVASLSSGNMVKGLISGCFGLTLAFIGLDPVNGAIRLTFGTQSMMNGIQIIPALIALFAIGELLYVGEKIYNPALGEKQAMHGTRLSLKEFLAHWKVLLQSSLIGTFIGAVPGTGGGTAAFFAYSVARTQSKHPEEFGHGAMEGVAAAESSNNGVTGGALIPMLTLGVPGDPVTAVLLGAMMIQGITPGPLIFQTDGETVFGIYALLIVCNIFMLIFGKIGIPLFSKVTDIPTEILQPIVLGLCCIGTYAITTRQYELICMAAIGAVAYIMVKFSMPTSPALLGLILGPMIELNLRSGLIAKRGDLFKMFAGRPIALVILGITMIALTLSIIGEIKEIKKKKTAAQIYSD